MTRESWFDLIAVMTIGVIGLGLTAFDCSNQPKATDAATPVTTVVLPPSTTMVGYACANLRAQGCAEGAPNCETVLTHIQEAGLTEVDTGCIVNATTKTMLRLCAGIGARGCP